ncbi:MAG: ABC transporter permease, partial [Actinomycetota bacterium]
MAGVSLGTGLVTAVESTSRGVVRQIREMVVQAAGGTDLEVGGYGCVVSESALEAVHGVAAVAAAAPVIERNVLLRDSRRTLHVLAVDLLADSTLRAYSRDSEAEFGDPIDILAYPNAIALDADFMASVGVKLGETLEIRSPTGWRPLRVVGSVRPRGMAQAYGHTLALMDVYNAQVVFGSEGRFDRIDVSLAPGADREAAAAEIRGRLGGSQDVRSPMIRARAVERLFDGYMIAIRFAAAHGMVVGGLVVFLTLWMSVVHRRREFAVLRLIGADQGAVLSAILGEAIVLGAIGVIMGIPAGFAVARTGFGLVRYVLAASFGPFTGGEAAIEPGVALLAVVASGFFVI